MIIRERAGSFVLVRQHDHALISGEFARHWSERPSPYEPTVHAIANHDIAWKGPDSAVRWDEERNRPYSFTDYPVEEKLRAYAAGLDLLEGQSSYAACLCSMHYETLVRQFGRTEAEARFAEAESRRQESLKDGLSREELANLGRNLQLLKLCDGLSLFLCLNEPGGGDYPPPYPGGFRFEGTTYEPAWEDRRTLRLEPDPFDGPFEVCIPYEEFGRDRRWLGGGEITLRIGG